MSKKNIQKLIFIVQKIVTQKGLKLAIFKVGGLVMKLN